MATKEDRAFIKKTLSSGKNSRSNELNVYVREFLVRITMKDIHQPPVCHSGVARHVTPQRSPPFLSLGPEGDSRFLSVLEADGGKTFFQFSSPGRDKCRPFIRKHWEQQSAVIHVTLLCSAVLTLAGDVCSYFVHCLFPVQTINMYLTVLTNMGFHFIFCYMLFLSK